MEGLRQANGIIAGIAGMPWRRFLAYNALGAVLWAGLWTSLGDLAGQPSQALLYLDELASYCLHALAAAGSLPSEAAVRRLLALTMSGLRPLGQ